MLIFGSDWHGWQPVSIIKKLNDWQFKILSCWPFNCWSDIVNQENKEMMSLPADVPDKLNGQQSVDSETLFGSWKIQRLNILLE